MSEKLTERCVICGHPTWLAEMAEPCDHPPEQWAEVTVRQVMEDHAPTLRAAFRAALAVQP